MTALGFLFLFAATALAALLVALAVLRHYLFKIIDWMPTDRWVPFTEIVKETNTPRPIARHIMYSGFRAGRVMVRMAISPEATEDDLMLAREVEEAWERPESLEFRIAGKRRQRKRKWKFGLPERKPIWVPEPA